MKKEDAIKNSSKLILLAWNDRDKYSIQYTYENLEDKYDELYNGYKEGNWIEKGYHLALIREDTTLTVLKEC